jgi:hypothetical protein
MASFPSRDVTAAQCCPTCRRPVRIADAAFNAKLNDVFEGEVGSSDVFVTNGGAHRLQKLIHEYARRDGVKIKTKRTKEGLLVLKIGVADAN